MCLKVQRVFALCEDERAGVSQARPWRLVFHLELVTLEQRRQVCELACPLERDDAARPAHAVMSLVPYSCSGAVRCVNLREGFALP